MLSPELKWTGQPVGDKPLLVVAPNAYGDCFERARWLPELTKRGINWVLAIRPELLSVFRTTFPENTIVNWNDEPPSEFGFWVDALDDLAAVLSTPRPSAIQYKAAPDKIQKYANLPHPAVGICVQSASRLGDSWRSLKEFEARKVISSVTGINWVSLQHSGYLKEYEKSLPCLNPTFDSWDDTLGLIKNLDAVVAVDSAIAHLSLSMGKPTVVLFGTAPTSMVKYTDFRAMYPTAVLQTFTPIYGGSQAAHSWELLIERTKKSPHFLRLLTEGKL